ncbi:molybdopterin molybdotransferase MoeA [Gleimia hominis]|uniref:Molybdopterin molybdenumtransferase n=1 Tax=Gleimia hominis TaxID=595468 RepID=A0ABU3IET7_9ACTO|nr:gephyrin-like molybdotransferase Glp [Gleimia hominis]MDT3767992.1 molybdopterin molybdotransferase MoeA [Gleimia hominis]WIK63782.1 molybdopterin molybdotransferase MoeA [Gleimia hominis]
MRTVAGFYRDCQEAVGPQPPLEVLLADAIGCVLAEDVQAPFDLPVADLAGCDGYAVRTGDLEGASADNPIELNVTAELHAGDVDPMATIKNGAVRIASGAPIPTGANAVVALEHTDLGEAKVQVTREVVEAENIRPRAQDVRAGDVVIKRGTRVSSRQIALIAGVGRNRVLVHPRPRVVIISIGDEIVEPGQPARPGSVFDANGHALATAVADAGAQTFRVAAVPDERATLRQTIEDQLVRADLIVTTGGISYGSGDTVREVLGLLGTVRFDSVAAWPGHVLGVGKVGDGTPIFCLPGDPVSAQVGFEVYVRPAVRAMQGWSQLNRPTVHARVDSGWYSPKGRREFVRVRLSGEPRGGYRATVQGTPTALLLSALANSNALAVVPEDVTDVQPGDTLACMILD